MIPINIPKAGGAVVPAICDVPEGAGQIVIMVHGFESSKACATGQLLFRRMVPAGLGVIAYDQPGHGRAEADPVVPVAAARAFAARYRIPIAVFPGENHSLNADPKTPDRVADLALAFFRGAF